MNKKISSTHILQLASVPQMQGVNNAAVVTTPLWRWV